MYDRNVSQPRRRMIEMTSLFVEQSWLLTAGPDFRTAQCTLDLIFKDTKVEADLKD